MYPKISINYPAIGVAVVVSMVFGFLWYGPIFGKVWAKLMNFPPDFKPTPQQFARAMVLMLVGSFLVAYVLAHTIQVWRASTWGLTPDLPDWKYGFFGAFFTWLGFYVPVLWSSVAWEGKSWKLFAINATYHLVLLQLVGAIIAHWR